MNDAATPQQPHPFYVQRIALNHISELGPESTEAVIGDIQVPLPTDDGRGILAVLWLFAGVVPVALGAGLIRPALNAMLTKRVEDTQYGGVLGASAAMVSAANAVAPLLAGVVFQIYGPTAPFLAGGVMLIVLLTLASRLMPAAVTTPDISNP